MFRAKFFLHQPQWPPGVLPGSQLWISALPETPHDYFNRSCLSHSSDLENILKNKRISAILTFFKICVSQLGDIYKSICLSFASKKLWFPEQGTVSVHRTHPDRQIHWGSAHNLHHRRIHRRAPSTLLQHCSACEGACLLVPYCEGHTSRSQALKLLARHPRESVDTKLGRGLWLDSGGRR